MKMWIQSDWESSSRRRQIADDLVRIGIRRVHDHVQRRAVGNDPRFGLVGRGRALARLTLHERRQQLGLLPVGLGRLPRTRRARAPRIGAAALATLRFCAWATPQVTRSVAGQGDGQDSHLRVQAMDGPKVIRSDER